MIEAYAKSEGYKDSAIVEATLTIKRALITVTAGTGQSKIYGSADPALTQSTFTGKPTSGKTIDWGLHPLDFEAALRTLRASGEDAGSYATRAYGSDEKSQLLSINPNYNFEFVGGTFTINPFGITVQYDANVTTELSKIYGKVDPALVAEVIPTTGGATFPGTGFDQIEATDFVLSRASGEDVGDYSVSIVNFDALKAGAYKNFSFTVNLQDFEITKRNINASMDSVTKIYGESDPAFGYTLTDGTNAGTDATWFTNFLADQSAWQTDFERDFTTFKVERSSSDIDKENVSDSPLDLQFSFGPKTSQNYRFNATVGTLTINKRPITVIANSGGPFTHTGNPFTVSGYKVSGTAGMGLVATQSFDKAFKATGTGTAVGTYSVTFNKNSVKILAPDTWKPGDSQVFPGATMVDVTANYDISYKNGSFQIVSGFVPTTNYFTYTVNYYRDAVAGGNFLGSTSGSVAEPGGVIAVNANLYRSAALIADGYGNGVVYGSTNITFDGQTINVVYFAGGPGEEEEEETPPPETRLPTPPVPQGGGDSNIPEAPNPEAGAPKVYWALLNLILAIASVITGIILIIGLFKKNQKEELESRDFEQEEVEHKSGAFFRIVGILLAVVAPIVFFLTENIRNPMTFTDRWTLLMGIILLAQVIAVIFMRYVRNKVVDKSTVKDGNI